MKNRILISLLGLVVAAMMAIPASAQNPEPATAPTELEKSGLVTPLAESSPIVDGEDKELFTAPDLSETIPDPGLASHIIRMYGRTYLSRYGIYVRSRGLSWATRRMNYIRTSNYLCRNGSCSRWYTVRCYSCSQIGAGWRWWSPDRASWYSRSYHYFRYGSSVRSGYSRWSGYF